MSLQKGKDNSYEELSDLEDEEVYSSLNDDKRSPQSMLGPLPVPPKALHAPKACECDTKEPVCEIEGGIKFNPCYTSKLDLSSDLCDVMLDAVWRAGQSTASHAGRAKCGQCAQFSRKLQSDMHNMVHNKKRRPVSKLSFDKAPSNIRNANFALIFLGRHSCNGKWWPSTLIRRPTSTSHVAIWTLSHAAFEKGTPMDCR